MRKDTEDIKIEKVAAQVQEAVAEAMFVLGTLHEDRENYPEARRLYQTAAKEGHHEAMVALGVLAELGLGQRRDNRLARRWYRKAAHSGSAWGSSCLGFLYETGRGGRKYHALAARHYLMGAQKRHPWCMVQLAMLYRSGKGVRRDLAKAAWLLARAAEAGNAYAQDYLAKQATQGGIL
ncbi:MAG: tetratricopeptide repeat protein [Planctomycetaceae bacterium]|nr:sel1 repeat family protein [Planctomycetaceae bacterium]